jgi:hypothetical protein
VRRSSSTRLLPSPREYSPWMRSGSATMSRTVIRGFSDAYGSWNTIWMSRRIGRICLRLRLVMSRPSKTILPAVGSSSFMMVRPSVVFPHPDSPTTPSVSPGRIARLTPSTARTWPTVRLRMPALIGKCLTRSSMRSRSLPFEDGSTGEVSGVTVCVSLMGQPWLHYERGGVWGTGRFPTLSERRGHAGETGFPPRP